PTTWAPEMPQGARLRLLMRLARDAAWFRRRADPSAWSRDPSRAFRRFCRWPRLYVLYTFARRLR
ncbi:MAG: hypothetical protein SNJ61_09905, partial [Fimbriimonadaceae bacterium]